MKKLLLLFTIAILHSNNSFCQEWFTSFDVAQRLALAEDKMLFVMWQNTLDYPYYVTLINDKGISISVDLNENIEVNNLIWEYFIPVILLESDYDEVYNKAEKTQNLIYLDKLKDDSIKIMDVNGNILNANSNSIIYENLSQLINRYALNTKFLKQDLIYYSKEKNVTTSFNLASKYLDFSIYVQKDVREEIIKIANIYFNEAKNYLGTSELINKVGFSQRLDFLDIKKLLILDNSRKARRLLKKIAVEEIDSSNLTLFDFLNYTTFKLLKEEEEAALWKGKLSSKELKMAELIIINNL